MISGILRAHLDFPSDLTIHAPYADRPGPATGHSVGFVFLFAFPSWNYSFCLACPNSGATTGQCIPAASWGQGFCPHQSESMPRPHLKDRARGQLTLTINSPSSPTRVLTADHTGNTARLPRSVTSTIANPTPTSHVSTSTCYLPHPDRLTKMSGNKKTPQARAKGDKTKPDANPKVSEKSGLPHLPV